VAHLLVNIAVTSVENETVAVSQGLMLPSGSSTSTVLYSQELSNAKIYRIKIASVTLFNLSIDCRLVLIVLMGISFKKMYAINSH